MSAAVVQEPFRLDLQPGRAIRGVVTRPADRPPGGTPFVLVVHGFKGFLRWGFFPELHRRLAAAGMAAVAYNESGSGVGEDLETFDDDAGFEANTYSRELADLEAVRTAVEAGKWPSLNHQMGAILAHSRGGAIALLHAAERPGLRAAVAWAALDSVVRWDAGTRAQWLRDGVLLVPNARTGQTHRVGLGLLRDAEANAARLDVAAACARLTLPVLLYHGDRDESVPPEALERLAAALPPGLGEARLVRGAGHTFGAVHPFAGTTPELEEVLGGSLAFLARHLLPKHRPAPAPGP
jgi:pimeloyl-ACP methyl ester carboxylesterase